MGAIEVDQWPGSFVGGVRHAYIGGLAALPMIKYDDGYAYPNSATIKKCVAMNPSLTAPHGDIEDTGRIGVFDTSDLSNNYALNTMTIKIDGKDVSVTGTTSDKNGQDKTAAELAQQSTYTGLGWNFDRIWKMSVNGYPIFKWEEDTPLATPPTITSQPKSQTVNVGDSVTFSVTATGTEPLSYQWYKNSSMISGATSSSYTISSVNTSDAGSYFVVVSNSAGSVTSSVATLTVNAPVAPVIVTQPVSQTVDVGQNVRFSVVATGTEPLNYQWLKNGAAIPGATSSSYTISSAKMEDAGNYMVIVSNSVGMAVSNPATLTVKDPAVPPIIIVQPKSQEVLIGESVTFSVTATGTEPLSYQWLFNGNPIAGATSSTYSISQVTEAHAGNYSVIVSNVAGTAISSTAVLTVKILPPVIVMHPQTQIIMRGSTATFAVIAEGYGLSYQWTFNGKDIAGANQSVYMIPAAEAGNVGSYAVKVSNKAGSVTSQSAMLWLNNLQMYAGVEVYGPVGAKFTVWYKDDAESGEWKKLTTSTVSASPTVVIDYDSPKNTKRFYKVEIE
ncbi:MAG: immunoglobulin domain-containing protein [Verrucomicrobia bacterium]|nr:immunoglobulin domain-containing protein [Verrucomicrobiota bacterium]